MENIRNYRKSYGMCQCCKAEKSGYAVDVRKRGGVKPCIVCFDCVSKRTHKPIDFNEVKGTPSKTDIKITARLVVNAKIIDVIKANGELMLNDFAFRAFSKERTAVLSSWSHGFNKPSKDLAIIAYLVSVGAIEVSNVRLEYCVNGGEIQKQNIDFGFAFDSLRRAIVHHYKK